MEQEEEELSVSLSVQERIDFILLLSERNWIKNLFKQSRKLSILFDFNNKIIFHRPILGLKKINEWWDIIFYFRWYLEEILSKEYVRKTGKSVILTL